MGRQIYNVKYYSIVAMKQTIGQFENILIFVQKTNDIDSIAGALAIKYLISHNFKDKKCFIACREVKSRYLPDINKHLYRANENEDKENTLGILVDIPVQKQISNDHLISQCKNFIIVDHHDIDVPNPFEEGLTKSIIKEFRDPSYSSCCEYIWDLINKDGLEINSLIAETLAVGIWGETLSLASSEVNNNTFRILHEISEQGIDINKLKKDKDIGKMSFDYIQLLSQVLVSSTKCNGKICIMNLNFEFAKEVLKYKIKHPDRVRKNAVQDRPFSYILRYAIQMIQADIYVFMHYSLYDPYNTKKKMIFIELAKENPIVEMILKNNDFKKQRNRWFKTWSLENLFGMISKYKKEFGAEKWD